MVQVDKELASGEYFLKEKERVAKKKELKKVVLLVIIMQQNESFCGVCGEFGHPQLTFA